MNGYTDFFNFDEYYDVKLPAQRLLDLAWCYEADGQLNNAIKIREELCDKNKLHGGLDHVEYDRNLAELAAYYLQTKDAGRARATLAQLKTRAESEAGQHWTNYSVNVTQHLSDQASIALTFVKLKQYDAAEQIVRECLKTDRRVFSDWWFTYSARAILGECLLGQMKYKDAEPLLKEGYEGMKQREKTMPPEAKARLTEALERLVQLYAATGNAAEADLYRKELAARTAAEKTPKK